MTTKRLLIVIQSQAPAPLSLLSSIDHDDERYSFYLTPWVLPLRDSLTTKHPQTLQPMDSCLKVRSTLKLCTRFGALRTNERFHPPYATATLLTFYSFRVFFPVRPGLPLTLLEFRLLQGSSATGDGLPVLPGEPPLLGFLPCGLDFRLRYAEHRGYCFP